MYGGLVDAETRVAVPAKTKGVGDSNVTCTCPSAYVSSLTQHETTLAEGLENVQLAAKATAKLGVGRMCAMPNANLISARNFCARPG